MTTASPTTNPFLIPWPCLQSDMIATPKSLNQTVHQQTKQHKTFTQALSNVCDIPLSQLPKSCLKGGDVAIQIPDEEYEAGLEACKHNLQGRIIWLKGSSPITVESLRAKLFVLWKALHRWEVISIGKGFYEFCFIYVEDMRRVRSIGSWNLNPEILKLFSWSKDFKSTLLLEQNVLYITTLKF